MHVRECSEGEGGEESLDGGGGGVAHSPEDHGASMAGGQASCNGSGGSQSGSLLGVEWSDAVRALLQGRLHPPSSPNLLVLTFLEATAKVVVDFVT